MDLKFTENIENVLKDNGLKKEEVLDIVNQAENNGNKLKSADGQIYIAKGVSDNLSIYVLYNSNEIMDVYTHKMNIIGLTGGDLHPVELDDKSEWVCAKCDTEILERNIDMTYLDVTRPGPGLICPKCGDMYVSPGVAKTLKTAEGILEEKRA